jgi:DNA-directed RNA polymerase subunit RPC12/RpoP
MRTLTGPDASAVLSLVSRTTSPTRGVVECIEGCGAEPPEGGWFYRADGTRSSRCHACHLRIRREKERAARAPNLKRQPRVMMVGDLYACVDCWAGSKTPFLNRNGTSRSARCPECQTKAQRVSALKAKRAKRQPTEFDEAMGFVDELPYVPPGHADAVDARPFMDWFERWLTQFSEAWGGRRLGVASERLPTSLEDLFKAAGVSVRVLSRMRREGRASIGIIDALLVHLDGPRLDELYPCDVQ